MFMRPGARRHQVPPPLPGLPGAGPPQPSAGRGETKQRVPRRSRRIPPIHRLLRARLRLLPPPPRIPEPPDSLAASAARGGDGAGPAPAPPLAAAAARQHRPHLIEGPRPFGHAPAPPPAPESRTHRCGPDLPPPDQLSLPIGPRAPSSALPLLLIGSGKGHDTGQGRGGAARGRSGRAPPGGGRRQRTLGPAPPPPRDRRAGLAGHRTKALLGFLLGHGLP